MSSIKYCVVESGFEPRSSQTKDYKIGICCFSAKHAALRRKGKDWLTQNQNNVSEWGYMSICRLLFHSPRFLCRLTALISCCCRSTSEGDTYGKQRICFSNSGSAHFHISWLSDFIFFALIYLENILLQSDFSFIVCIDIINVNIEVILTE